MGIAAFGKHYRRFLWLVEFRVIALADFAKILPMGEVFNGFLWLELLCITFGKGWFIFNHNTFSLFEEHLFSGSLLFPEKLQSSFVLSALTDNFIDFWVVLHELNIDIWLLITPKISTLIDFSQLLHFSVEVGDDHFVLLQTEFEVDNLSVFQVELVLQLHLELCGLLDLLFLELHY